MSDEHGTAIVEAPRATLEERRELHPLVELATANGQPPDPEMLSKLMDLQERWEAGESRKAYTRALVALKRDLPAVIAKDGTVDFESSKGRTFYKHATLAGAMAAVIGPLTAHGFALTWNPSVGERGEVIVTCRLTHSEGHHEEATIPAPPDKSGNKNSAQAVASTITYLSRYTALSLLGIATADMTEPTGEQEQSPEAIDPARNMNAVRALKKAGIDREEAETHLGRPVSEWTRSDRDRIRTLIDAHEEADKPATTGEASDEEHERMERDAAKGGES